MNTIPHLVTRQLDSLLKKIGLREETTGVAFSGGGARGFTHIGVMKAFDKFGISPGVISGVSAGSIAAVLYAAGLSTDEMIECFQVQEKFGKFAAFKLPKESFLSLERFSKLLESWLPVRNIEDLKIPTIVCATDFDHGKSVGWSRGEIVPRVVASCSIPIVFPPVRINGVNYVDGGVMRNLPAWAIRRYCSCLIGCNCSPISRNFSYKGSIADLALRSYQLMSKSNVPQDLQLCDIIISPEHIDGVGTFDLTNIRRLVNLGYDAACRTLDKMYRQK